MLRCPRHHPVTTKSAMRRRSLFDPHARFIPRWLRALPAIRSWTTGKGDLAHQQTVPWLLSNKSPVNRLLVVHRTGSGKTLTMIRTLEKLFADQRGKVIVFPTQELVKNFYMNLLQWPNKYRAAFLKAKGWRAIPAEHTRGEKFKELLNDVEGFLAKKGNPRNHRRLPRTSSGTTGKKLRYEIEKARLASPLRAFRYTEAGGSKTKDPVFRIDRRGIDKKTQANRRSNPYNDVIVLMDEFHNLVGQSKYEHLLKKLEGWLRTCTGSVVVGFTATPVVVAPAHGGIGAAGNKIMAIIKGPGDSSRNMEGFVSYFNTMPDNVYPATNPKDTRDIESTVVPVQLQAENDKKYAAMHAAMQKKTQLTKSKRLSSLQRYCNTSFYQTGHASSKSFAAKLKTGTNGLDKFNAENYSTKFFKIAQFVANAKGKTLVLVHRQQGFRVMRALMNHVIHQECGNPLERCKQGGWVGLYNMKDTNGIQKNVGHNGEAMLQEFNSIENLHGERMKAMLVDAAFFSEGVSFKGVRNLILVNPPPTYAAYQQRIGRALRMCVYDVLPPKERNVTIKMYVAKSKLIETTADEEVLAMLVAEKNKIEGAMSVFEKVAVDRTVLTPLFSTSS